MKSKTNEELINLIINHNDNLAFIELEKRFKKDLDYLANFHYQIHGYSSEDLYQEFLMSIFNSLENFKNRCDLRTYLITTIKSKTSNLICKVNAKKRRPIKDDKIYNPYSLEKAFEGCDTNFMGIIGLDNNDLDNKDELNYLITLLSEELSRTEEDIFTLFYIKQKSRDNICQILDLTYKSVDNALTRINEKAKEIYKIYLGDKENE